MYVIRNIGKLLTSVNLNKKPLLYICILFLLILFFFNFYKNGKSPPKLIDCNRIEFSYGSGTLSAVIPIEDYYTILSSSELEYIQSLKTFEITDPKIIQTFIHNISLVEYYARSPFFKISKPPWAVVICYNNKKRLMSLNLYANSLLTDDGRYFNYPISGLHLLQIFKPKDLVPFEIRYRCIRRMTSLYFKQYYRKENYPNPNQWCDIISKDLRNQYVLSDGIKRYRYSEREIIEFFSCPGVIENYNIDFQDQLIPSSSYAMNPNCTFDSPKDMVLLFETKAGWNQHGGPELFTFDNHNPKGGCVLFNDGTVKFIRTEEELNNLKWK